jgi:hypothetical protein
VSRKRILVKLYERECTASTYVSVVNLHTVQTVYYPGLYLSGDVPFVILDIG